MHTDVVTVHITPSCRPDPSPAFIWSLAFYFIFRCSRMYMFIYCDFVLCFESKNLVFCM